MNGAIGEILPLALGVAISPIPILAVILMLLSARAAITSTGFLIGWVVGIIVATSVFTVLADVINLGDSSTSTGWTKIAIGLLLLLLGVRQFRVRHVDRGTPKWMSAMDSLTFPKAAGLGLLLAAFHPKNLLMAVAAGVAIGGAGLSVGSEVVAVAIYTVLAASTVAIPVIAFLIARDRMRRPLDGARARLQENNTTVMAVLLLVIGVVLIGKGIGAL